VSAPLPEGAHGVRLIVAYDGTRFHGYQAQDGQRTVQGVIEDAIAGVTGKRTRARAAGRTDAGVHALGQVVAFDTDKQLPARSWAMALNAHLPDDVAVQDTANCDAGYNPRFDAVEKTYRYVIDLGLARHPLFRDRAWHLGPQIERRFGENEPLTNHEVGLDRLAMRSAAAMFIGTHDFRALRAADDQRENTTRTLRRLDLIDCYWNEKRLFAIEVTGDAFMKNMVRILAGTLLDVGRNRISIASLPDLLSARGERRQAGPTAPACGLSLVSVKLGRIAAQASHSAL
jgi:tRNA pseudouridine38-40 synthase